MPVGVQDHLGGAYFARIQIHEAPLGKPFVQLAVEGSFGADDGIAVVVADGHGVAGMFQAGVEDRYVQCDGGTRRGGGRWRGRTADLGHQAEIALDWLLRRGCLCRRVDALLSRGTFALWGCDG